MEYELNEGKDRRFQFEITIRGYVTVNDADCNEPGVLCKHALDTAIGDAFYDIESVLSDKYDMTDIEISNDAAFVREMK